MKKTRYDLSIFELGLRTRAFYYVDVLNVLYGRYEYDYVGQQTEDGWKERNYYWSLTNFQDIPMATRRNLVKLLFEKFDILSKCDGLREEFEYRILCTLRTILEKEKVYVGEQQGRYDMYRCSFEDLIYPTKVMKEFLMWHQAGLPIFEEEKKLLNDCITKFLSEGAPYQGTTSQRIEWKKARWQLRLKKVNKKINAHNALLGKWYNQAAKLKAEGKIAEAKAIEDKYNHMCDEEMDPLYTDRNKYAQELALAEAYPILTGNFPSLEWLISQYDNPSDEKAC